VEGTTSPLANGKSEPKRPIATCVRACICRWRSRC